MKQHQSSEFMPVEYYYAISWSMAVSGSVWKAVPSQVQTPPRQVMGEEAHCSSIPLWNWSSQPQQISVLTIRKQSVLSSRDLIRLFAWLSGKTSLPIHQSGAFHKNHYVLLYYHQHNAGRAGFLVYKQETKLWPLQCKDCTPDQTNENQNLWQRPSKSRRFQLV